MEREGTSRPAVDEDVIERASMLATFSSTKRAVLLGLITVTVVVGVLLLAADVDPRVVAGFVALSLVSRGTTAWIAHQGKQVTDIHELRRWSNALDISLVPMGALGGGAAILVPRVESGVSPFWFGLLLSAAAVAAANVLIGHGRSRPFIALTVPLLGLAVVSCLLVGGYTGVAFAIGGLSVGTILFMDNREAGAVFREARQFEEENRTLVAELEAANALLAHQVHTDSLTGLTSRAGLRPYLEKRQAAGGSLAVVYVDLDGFKTINDELGHAAGDQVLQVIGGRLVTAIRSNDCAARVGGDEFLIISAVDEAQTCDDLVARVQACFDEPIDVESTLVSVGASIGAKQSSGHEDLDLVMRLADGAMYEQKRDKRRRSTDVLNEAAGRGRSG